MIEIPEAIVLTNQINKTLKGKKINHVIANSSPHGFAFFHGNPDEYNDLLSGKIISEAKAYAGWIKIEIDEMLLVLSEGLNLRFLNSDKTLPKKHQLLIIFDDDSCFVVTVSMYAAIMCCTPKELNNNKYYNLAVNSISPLSDEFDYEYFLSLFNEKTLKLSAKAFLATDQRIPGLGNGVLQDILLNAKIHPKKKMNTLTEEQKTLMFNSIKSTLFDMFDKGGRNTERDLFGNPGGYSVKLSKNTVLSICQNCGGTIKKESYLGGSIYFCDTCQEK